MTDLTLTVSRRVGASPERAFAAWLDPEMLARFMLPGDAMSVPRAETDPREGGRFAIVMKTPEREILHEGVYLEIDPPRRLVFTWQSPMSLDDSRVTLEFRAGGEGTDITLTHEKFIDAAARDAHEQGWTSILAALDSATSAAAEGASR